MSRGLATIAFFLVILFIASSATAQGVDPENPIGEDDAMTASKAAVRDRPQRGGYGKSGMKRWTPDPVPASADEARDPIIELAIRTAPEVPPEAFRYLGANGSLQNAQEIAKRVLTFFNFRAAIALATWKVDPAFEWRVRPSNACFDDLRRQKIRFEPWCEELEPGESERASLEPTPTPIHLKGLINGVSFASGHGGGIVISCELASRLEVFAKIAARHDVERVVITSSYRAQPRPSFHTMGLALDIAGFHTRLPLMGPNGRRSTELSVLTDFLETPELATCDPSLFAPDSPLGNNERGRTLLAIACELHASGVFASVLTPNYNPGHRNHFHVDIRPDDPRIFLR